MDSGAIESLMAEQKHSGRNSWEHTLVMAPDFWNLTTHPRDTSPPRPHLPIFPNSSINWGPSTQTKELIGTILTQTTTAGQRERIFVFVLFFLCLSSGCWGSLVILGISLFAAVWLCSYCLAAISFCLRLHTAFIVCLFPFLLCKNYLIKTSVQLLLSAVIQFPNKAP